MRGGELDEIHSESFWVPRPKEKREKQNGGSANGPANQWAASSLANFLSTTS